MKTRWWMIPVGAALLLAIAFVLTPGAMARSTGLADGTGWSRGPHQGGPAGRGGGGMGPMGGSQDSLVAVAAETLGMEQADLVAQLQAGTTIAQLAGDKTATIVDAFVASRSERFAAMVEAGRLTQAQADQQLATVRANATARVEAVWTAGGSGQGMGFVDENGDGVCDHAAGGMAGRGPGGMQRGMGSR